MWKKGVAFGEMWNLKGRKGRKEGQSGAKETLNYRLKTDANTGLCSFLILCLAALVSEQFPCWLFLTDLSNIVL